MEAIREKDDKQKKRLMMTTTPIPRLVLKLATPTVISMLVTAVYNIVDTFFVGQIGTAATAGVGLVLPLMTIIQAFGFFFGQGSGNFISRALGAEKEKEAEQMVATGTFLAFLFGALIMAVGLLLPGPILSLLGAKSGAVTDDTIRYAKDYYTLILIGAPVMCTSYVLNNQLRFQGNAFFSMVGLVIGAVLNCALDPLFIFLFKMEVTGAALATILSQTVGFIILYVGTMRSDSLKIRFRAFRPNFTNLKHIMKGGAPSLFRQGLQSVAIICLNLAAGTAAALQFGALGEAEMTLRADAAIAAFSIAGKVTMFIVSAMIGFGQGFQPICGFNYGAGKFERVRKAYTFCMKLSFIVMTGISALVFIFAPQIVRAFRDNPLVIEFGTTALRFQVAVLPLAAVLTMTNMLYQNIGKVFGATLLAVSRQGVVFIPVVLVLPYLITPALYGVYLAQPVSDVIAFLMAVPFAVRIYRTLRMAEKTGSIEKTPRKPG